jgi:hypothetical protein
VPLFRPNISRAGRLIRLGIAFMLAGGGFLLLETAKWAAVILFLSAAFVLFEALRGWCVMRACGIKTRF